MFSPRSGRVARQIFSGSVAQIVDDAHRCAEIGADEVFIEVQYSPELDNFDAYMERMEQFAELVEVGGAAQI